MNCIVIDDEATSRIIIEQLCGRINGLTFVEGFENAIEGLKYLNKNEVDLIFLDIHMPDFSGFDFIQSLKHSTKIILTTSDKTKALEAFEYDCIVDFLVKPISFDRFQKAVQKAKAFSVQIEKAENNSITGNSTPNDFYVNIDRTLIKIEADSVNVVEAKGDYILIKTTTKDYRVHTTMKNIEGKLPAQLFFKVHRSFIINVSKIIDIQDNSIVIDSNVVPISRSKRPELMEKLNLL